MELPLNGPWAAPAQDDDDPESGFTLMELIVSIGIFTVFLVMLLSTTVTLAQNTTRTQLTAEATNSALVVFGRLDRQARYADSVNFPVTGPSGSRYIEFRTPATSSASGVTLCTQWKFTPSTGLLESRQWNDGASSAPAFTTAMTNVIDDGAGYPFALTTANITDSALQQISVTIHAGNQYLNAGALVTSAFAARNSSISSPSNVDSDNNKVSDLEICKLSTGSVPRP